MASTKIKSTQKPKARKATAKRKTGLKTAKTTSWAKALLMSPRSRLLLTCCLCLVLVAVYSSVTLLRSVSADTSTVSWTGSDPTFSVDVDQTKTAPSLCDAQQVVIGNDTNESTVCVVKRSTWRYGKYTHDVCTWRGCSQETGYAIGFGTDPKMYRMRDMPEFWAPYLVPGSDTMAVRDINGSYYTLGIIKDFPLQFNPVTAADGSQEYVYNGSSYFKFSKPNGDRMQIQALGASLNGAWLVAEAPDVGLFRINLSTFEVKRFSTTVYDYWKGSNPTMEFAVSNDGTSIAAMGFNAGFVTYSVNSTCGDTLTDTMTKATPIAAPCAQKDMTTFMTNNVPGFQFGFSPSFDDSGSMLNLQAYYQSSGANATEWVTLAYVTPPTPVNGNCLMNDGVKSTTVTNNSQCCVTNRSYPAVVRQMLGQQAEKMKVTCAGTSGSTDQANQDAWNTWQTNCLSLDTTLQAACKGISLEEFLQMYKGGTLKSVQVK